MDVGALSELLVAAELTKHGFEIARPVSPVAYDLVAIVDRTVNRVQVKGAGACDDDGRWTFAVTRNGRAKYTIADADFVVCVVARWNHYYVIPTTVISAGTISVRIDDDGKPHGWMGRWLGCWRLMDPTVEVLRSNML